MKTKLSLIIAILLISGCSKESNGGNYYELNYTDEVFSVITSDSVHVVVTQYGSTSIIKDSIPYSFNNNAQMGDTVKIKMDVKFGSPTQTPSPSKQITINKDTLFLWYASSLPSPSSLGKTSTINQVEAEPKPVYYSIQDVTITKSPNKFVTFQSINKGR